MKQGEPFLIVTPEQLKDGYEELVPPDPTIATDPVQTIHREYTQAEKLPDGNYKVGTALVSALTAPQPMPRRGYGPDIVALAIAYMQERDAFGLEKYGQTLQAFDGRNHIIDAVQEAGDLFLYLLQEYQERKMMAADTARLDALQAYVRDHVWIANTVRDRDRLSEWAMPFRPVNRAYALKFNVPFFNTLREVIDATLAR